MRQQKGSVALACFTYGIEDALLLVVVYIVEQTTLLQQKFQTCQDFKGLSHNQTRCYGIGCCNRMDDVPSHSLKSKESMMLSYILGKSNPMLLESNQ